MFSTLLVVTTLIGSQIVLASDSPAAAQVDTLKTDESTPVNRQSRQFWLPPPNPYVGQYFYGQNWPSPIPYSPEFRRQHTSSVDSPYARQNLFGLSNFNSVVNPLAVFYGLFSPLPLIANPNVENLLRRFSSCRNPQGKAGLCVPSGQCSKYGGRPSGTCAIPGLVCCVNAVAGCGGQVTLNNTYWESPATVSSDSTCGLTVTLDPVLVEQKRPICQLRLDFKSMVIDQPDANSVCSTDTFVVGGSTNKIPTICGDNTDQHMYIELPSSTTDVVLLFTFGKSQFTRSWNIQIGMLACGSSYLAPSGCLQYFRQTSGVMRSFNWKDVPVTATRQLANQEYLICHRNELFNNEPSNQICYTPCEIKNGGNSYLISGGSTPASTAVVGPTSCKNDFLIIRNSFDPLILNNVADRFCGSVFNTLAGGPANNAAPAGAGPVKVCSALNDYQVLVKTDDNEPAADVQNTGFCLDFTQQKI